MRRIALLRWQSLAGCCLLAATPAVAQSNEISIGISTSPPDLSVVSRFAPSAPAISAPAARIQATRPPQLPDKSKPVAPEPAVIAAPKVPLAPLKSPTWTQADIDAATLHCAAVLMGMQVKYTPLPARREGPCGTPAPIELTSIGSNPEIKIVPSITVSCDVAAALYKFSKEKMQPLARRVLGAPIVQINSMSSYSCRNRYGEKKGPLSFHALANAVDIRGFITAKGLSLEVEMNWGLTRRAIARLEAEKERLAAERKAAEAAAKATATTAQPAEIKTSATSGRKPEAAPVAPMVAVAPVAPKKPLNRPSLVSLTPDPAGPDIKAKFMRQLHREACGVFGTVLGPESNDAHNNHFHFDVAERRNGPFCQ
ncbi:MAG: extensin family protein [Hyphomicrobiaceae bacterium]|nr:MAG: extensin family protein [Hyphomicrobiaceae bacterium]